MEHILVYAKSGSNRLRYTTRLLFDELLGVASSLTNDIDTFSSAQGLRVNYSSETIDGVLNIAPASLLFEKRLRDFEVPVKREEVPKLFPGRGDLGFDPLAAIFYLVSRYEEYLPHRTDDHARFLSRESVAFKHEFLHLPLVEVYAGLIADKLGVVVSHSPQVEVSIDVDQAYAFRHKGWFRTSLGVLKDALRFDFKVIRFRLRTLWGMEQDPLDRYVQLLDVCSRADVSPLFFLQVGDNSRFDVNGPSYHKGFQALVSYLEREAQIGLHPSYFSSTTEGMLSKELNRLVSLGSAAIIRSRQHFLRFLLPRTFSSLEELGITHDYSMGYSDVNGFRASISRPYQFYNLERDEPSGLTIHPFCFMDIAAIRSADSLGQVEEEMLAIWQAVKGVGGCMSTVWHLESLFGVGYTPGSYSAFETMLKQR